MKLLIAQGADYTILSKEERVTRHYLDRIIPNRPFMMFSPDHHTAWANTAALEQARMLKLPDVGVGAEIVMAEDGLASGELREGGAIDPVRALGGAGRERLGLETGGEPGTAPTAVERNADRETIKRGLAHCARHGITSFHNMDGNFYQLELLAEIDRDGGLPVRARIPFHMKNVMPLSALEKASEMQRRYRSDRLRSGFVKLFMEERKGRVAPGLLADIVVLSDDIEAVDPQTIDKLHPLVTICDGRVTYEPDFRAPPGRSAGIAATDGFMASDF